MPKIKSVILVVFIFFLFQNEMNAQDKIITNSSDTISCKISRVTGKTIFFKRNSLASVEKIQRGDVKTWIINETRIREANKIFEEYQNGSWRFSFDGGVGHRIASTKESKQNFINQGFPANQADSYFKQIKTGVKASAQVHYMLGQKFGLGIDYQFHHSQANITGAFDPGDTYTLLYGKLSDDVFTNYTGISLYYQEWLNPKYKLYYQISMGLSMFREENLTLYTPALITGKAFGGNTEIGFEYFLKKNVAVAVNACLFQSTMSKIKVNNGFRTEEYKLEKEQREGLSRIDLGLGLKFYL
jgi:hypothetical protein